MDKDNKRFFKIGNFFSKGKFIILSIFILISIISIFFISKVKVNYDTTKYLPNDLQTTEALKVLEKEFGNNGYLQVMIEDLSSDNDTIYDKLTKIDGILLIEKAYKNNNALYKITLKEDNYSEVTNNAIKQIKDILNGYTIYLNQDAYIVYSYNNLVKTEIPKIILYLLPIILLILFLTTTSWLEPLLFVIVLGISVVINMGTNFIFGEISYMTEAIAPILQFALCMDYSIILLHRYQKIKETDPYINEYVNPNIYAVGKACKESFVPILASSLTTIAGFIAIMFMRYGIGFDIGIVLTKGVIISILTVMLLIPSFILLFAKLLEKTKHKSIINATDLFTKLVKKGRLIIPILALILIVAAIFIQSKNKYYYSDTTVSNQTEEMINNNNKINQEFGYVNNVIVLIPKNTSLEEEFNLINKLKNIKVDNELVTTSIISYNYLFNLPLTSDELKYMLNSYSASLPNIDIISNKIDLIYTQIPLENNRTSLNNIITFTYNNLFDYLTEEEKTMFNSLGSMITEYTSNFISDNYMRILLNVNVPYEDDKTFDYANQILEITKDIPNSYVVGNMVAINDIKTAIDGDYLKVSIITIILIFIIILLSFKSFSIPFLLIILIEGAIFINMAVPALTGNNLLFIGYIIVSCIQLGATIDYGILMSNRYIENRKLYDKDKSFSLSIKEALPTILTSGLILIVAGFALGILSNVPVISILGTLIGRGAVCSVLLVLIVLPELLFVCDKFVIKKEKCNQ